MECRHIYKLLCAYLDEELDLKRTKLIEEHLESCESCRTEVEIQRSVKLLVRDRFFNITAPHSLKMRVMRELERADEYRESGIEVLDLVRWGTHIAQLYKKKSDLTEVLVPYIARGLEQNELCVWVMSDISEAEARSALEIEVSSVQKYVDRGQLQIFSYENWYLLGGRFDCQCTLNNGLQKCQEALSNGYSGLRITGDAFWLEEPDWNLFMEYENRVNSVVHKYKMLIICAYKESKCTKDNIVDVINAHKYVISKMDDSWRLRRSAEIF